MKGSVRAKFRCMEVTRTWDPHERIKLMAVHSNGPKVSEENKSFWKATPTGALEFTITQPDAFGRFVPGGFYFLDFLPVEDEFPADAVVSMRLVVEKIARQRGFVHVNVTLVPVPSVWDSRNNVPHADNAALWTGWVPSSELTMSIDNPAASDVFAVGDECRFALRRADE